MNEINEERIEENKTTDVLIDGKVYSLGGADGAYLQRVAAFLNEQLKTVKGIAGYKHMDSAYQQLLLNLNLADAYFRQQAETEKYRAETEKLEKELYAVKHEIVGTKLKLEASLKQQEIVEQRGDDWKRKYEELKGKTDDQKG